MKIPVPSNFTPPDESGDFKEVCTFSMTEDGMLELKEIAGNPVDGESKPPQDDEKAEEVSEDEMNMAPSERFRKRFMGGQ